MCQRFAIPVATLFLFLFSTAATGQEAYDYDIGEKKIIFTGKAEVVDGDTIWVGIHKVRLYGIEALEETQPCYRNGERFRCYEKALDRLKEIVTNKVINCRIDRGNFGKPEMSYNRYVGTCYIDNTEINRTMIQEGWVVSTQGDQGDIYRASEQAASNQKLGIHQAEFKMPWDFRKDRDKKPTCPSGTHQCVPK